MDLGYVFINIAYHNILRGIAKIGRACLERGSPFVINTLVLSVTNAIWTLIRNTFFGAGFR